MRLDQKGVRVVNQISGSRSGTTRLVAGLLVLAAVLAAFGASSSAAIGATSAPGTAAASPKFDQKLFNLLPARIKKSKKVTFGALWETPPIIGVDPKKPSVPVGLAPDLVAAVGKVLGITPVWKNLQWPAQLPGLQSGNVDVLWGQVSDTKEREQSIADMVSWMQQPWAMLLPAGNPNGVTSLSNACGLKIAVPNGSVQDAIIAGNNAKYCGSKPMTTIGYPGAQEAVVAIKAGGADAWLDASSSIAAIVKAAPTTFTSIPLPNAQVVTYASNISGVAISKRQPGLTRAIAGALKKIAATGGAYQAAMKKWGIADGAMKSSTIKINIFTGLPAGKTAG
jgi:polar amino acid transport system substrate-binding protein